MKNNKNNSWLENMQEQWSKLKEKFSGSTSTQDLTDKMNDFQSRLEEAKNATKDEMEDLKQDLEEAWKDLKAAMRKES